MIGKVDIAFIDFDGTLGKIMINNYEIHKKKWINVLKECYGVKTNLSPIFLKLHLLYEKFPEAAMYVYKELDILEMEAEVRIYGYSFDLVKLLKSQNIPCVVVSNNCRAVIKKSLEKSGLLQFIDYIQSRELGIKPKPAPDMLRKAAKIVCGRSDVDYFLMIGDNINDLEAAFNYSVLSQSSFTFIWARDICKIFSLEKENEKAG